MKWIMMICCVSLIALQGVDALAQSPSGEVDVTEYKFNDEIVDGILLRPEGAVITTREPGKERSLIRVRGHFVQEMLKSVEDF